MTALWRAFLRRRFVPSPLPVILTCLFVCLSLYLPSALSAAREIPAGGRVTWIHDGDTLAVAGVGKVRLIGIDAPEHESGPRDNYLRRQGIPAARLRQVAADARTYLIRQVKGRQVRLAYDQTRRDRYGRVLAYVYLPDGTLLNRLLLEQGLAVVYRRFSFREKRRFLEAESQAKEAGRGVWAAD